MNNKTRVDKKNIRIFGIMLFLVVTLFVAFFTYRYIENKSTSNTNIVGLDINKLPEYNGKPYVVINNNEPNFDKSELVSKSFEKYSDIRENFPVIIGIKNLNKTAKLPKIFSETEIRSLEDIPFEDIIHIEIPIEKYNELNNKIRKYNQKVKIFPIELGELFEYENSSK